MLGADAGAGRSVPAQGLGRCAATPQPPLPVRRARFWKGNAIVRVSNSALPVRWPHRCARDHGRNPAIRSRIREDKVAQMYSAIQTGSQHGMQTLDGSRRFSMRRFE
jgi:hypothetical protein